MVVKTLFLVVYIYKASFQFLELTIHDENEKPEKLSKANVYYWLISNDSMNVKDKHVNNSPIRSSGLPVF